MPGDFFDEDLVRADGAARRAAEGQAAAGAGSDLDRLTRHHEEVSDKVAVAMKELELLRRKQNTLEKEKGHLEQLAQKQESYQRGKKELLEALATSVVAIEKDEVHATRMVELLGETRSRFSDALAEIRGIDEETWEERAFEEELNRALATVQTVRAGYKKALARLEAAGAHKAAGRETAVASDDAEPRRGRGPGFGYWLMVGVAVTLPLSALVAALFAVWLLLSGIL